MTESLTRFPCGEFRPGEGPRPGGASDIVPPVFKPDPVIIEDPFDPDRGGGGRGPIDPRGPTGPNPGDGSATEYNKCSKQILYCPPPLQDKVRTFARTLSTCRPSFIDLVTASTLYLDPRSGKVRFPDSYDKAADDLCLGVPARDSFWAGCISESFQCIVSVTGGPTTPRYYKCETTYVQCPPSARGGTAKLKLIKREKKSCNSIQAQADLPRSGLIPQGGSYNTGADNLCIQENQNNVNFWNGCVTQVFNNCITPDVLTPPTTPRYYMCQTIPEFCPSATRPTTGTTSTPTKPEVRTLTRRKVSCNSVSAAADQTRSSVINQTGPYTTAADDMCIAETAANVNFWDGCTGTVIVRTCTEPTNYNSVSLPGSSEENPRGTIRVLLDSIDGRNQRLSSGGTSTQSRTGSIDNSQLLAQSIIDIVPSKTPSETLDPSNEEYLAYVSPHDRTDTSRGLYDPTYNFFRVQPNVDTVLVNNDSYLNIFNTRVAREVKYFIDRESSILPWHEQPFADLTNDKIIVSLKYEVITAFNNIHSIGNTKLNLDYFIDMVRSHLYAGTLSEFDADFYVFIYNTQINDPIIEVPIQGESRDAIRAALAIFETKSKSPDFSQYSEKSRDDYKRMRVLLEDIQANIPTINVDGTETTLYLNNAGILTDMVGASSLYTDIGDGAGYYVSAQVIEESNAAIGFYLGDPGLLIGPPEELEFTTNPGEEDLLVTSEEVSGTVYPLVTDNQLSASRYLEPIYNYQILKLLGSDISLTLTASSAASANEFNDTYDVSAETPIMYFALNLQSVGDIVKPNSVLNPLSATYRRITDAEASAHSRNYSFNIVRTDIDFRDPLLSYARDTSTITVYQNDFNLRAFDENRTLINDRIILRNIPAAIIMVPGLGSVHNPFNGRSRLTVIDQNVSVRTLKLSPSFDINNDSLARPPLNETNIFNTLGTGYFGEYEQEYEQDVNGNIFTYNPSSSLFDRSYYYNGAYSRERPTMDRIDDPIEKTVTLDLVDKLASVSGVSSLTWWDIFTRLKSNQIGKLKLINPKNLLDKIADGWITNKKVKNVLGRSNPEYTGIPTGSTVPDDLIIITENDRTYIPNP